MSVHVMMDLETNAKRPGANILSIGATTFSVMGLGTETFYERIDINAWGDEWNPDEDTIDWWKRQDEDVYNEAWGGDRNPTEAIGEFLRWITDVNPDTIWCKGASFDFPIINYWLATELPYRKLRCARTYLNAAGVYVSHTECGKDHQALGDSVNQALAMNEARIILKQPDFL